jgi:predicted RNA-binding protein (virulence factor B family)
MDELLLGTVFTGIVTDENDKSYFVQKLGQTFKLSKEEGEHQIGDAVEGFGYQDKGDHLTITTKIPTIGVDHYAFGTVTGSRRDLGVFVDIGLPNKDVVVSLDDLPTMKELWPKEGDRLNIALRVDDKGRMWGVLADELHIRSLARPGTEEQKNADIVGTVYRLKITGTLILTEDYNLGFIHPDERFREPRLGEVVHGRVIGLLSHDGVLNISLKPRAHEAISDDAAMILTFLERSADGKIPFTDKSAPEEIKATFGISKGQFKRALGNLFKQRKIKQEDGYTWLIK